MAKRPLEKRFLCFMGQGIDKLSFSVVESKTVNTGEQVFEVLMQRILSQQNGRITSRWSVVTPRMSGCAIELPDFTHRRGK